MIYVITDGVVLYPEKGMGVIGRRSAAHDLPRDVLLILIFVQIDYSAFAVQSLSHRDPQLPVALDRAHGFPGLMEIRDRRSGS